MPASLFWGWASVFALYTDLRTWLGRARPGFARTRCLAISPWPTYTASVFTYFDDETPFGRVERDKTCIKGPGMHGQP